MNLKALVGGKTYQFDSLKEVTVLLVWRQNLLLKESGQSLC